MRFWLVLLSLACAAPCQRHVPTVDDILGLETLGASTAISPDGRYVAYSAARNDFKQDAIVRHIWLADTQTGAALQLTRGDKSCGSPQWSPDGKWLAFTSDRTGGKAQIFLISPAGGEALAITKAEAGVRAYDWSPDGKTIAFTAAEPEPKALKDRKEYLSNFEVVRRDYQHAHLWTVDVAQATREPQAGRQRTRGVAFTVDSIAWSPDSTRIAFAATANPDLTQRDTSDIYVLTLADDAVKKVVSEPGGDWSPKWSPDGARIAFASSMGRIDSAAYNIRIAVVPAEGGPRRSLTDAFDESPDIVEWTRDGLYFSALQKMSSHLFRLDPETGRIDHRITQPAALLANGFSLTADARQVAFTAASATALTEVFVAGTRDFAPRQLTSASAAVKDWELGRPEPISWKSRDGAVIEGVLIKPANFDPAKKHPLLCVIHGGPTGIDFPTLLGSGLYPWDAWTARGALVLRVNYRGSAGYGEAFRRLNIRNLGVGDAWDVLSGVDHLVKLGWADPARLGCMGWSQGGYISAFLTTTSDRFQAISVGAGISNWATYYYNTDITHFTRRYLGADPAADPEIYRKTSPMSFIKNAKTPTLIQHGDGDRRVPIANGYELRQGLEDQGVKVEMVVYKGMPHGPTTPKLRRAIMQHNLAWFNHYIWGDPLPDFTRPDVPKKADEGK
ncbi:MAG: S9 family peptidase [Bryobacterales bacterium]|nr:S9 family peptidase [Bryobacterales bacterium]